MTAANTEFVGTTSGWSSATLAAASLPKPRWLSELAGKSAGSNFTVGHAYDFGDYYGWMTSFFTAGGMNPLTIPGVALPMKDFFATNVSGYQGSVTFASDPG
ncbi:MAG TPA: hypothetical protein VLC98_05780, partial [Phnomibacter sp.]|nr:hypothetical protein [Phnomibacter sp.]